MNKMATMNHWRIYKNIQRVSPQHCGEIWLIERGTAKHRRRWNYWMRQLYRGHPNNPY